MSRQHERWCDVQSHEIDPDETGCFGPSLDDGDGVEGWWLPGRFVLMAPGLPIGGVEIAADAVPQVVNMLERALTDRIRAEATPAI